MKRKKKISENFQFLVVKFSIYLNRHVFVMYFITVPVIFLFPLGHGVHSGSLENQLCRVFPGSHFGSFYPQNLVWDSKKLGERVLSDAYIIKFQILFIYGFVFYILKLILFFQRK